MENGNVDLLDRLASGDKTIGVNKKEEREICAISNRRK
jgi:hypothetical protein